MQQAEARGEIQRSSGSFRLNLVSNGCCVSPSGSALDPVPPPLLPHHSPPPLDLMSSILGELEKKKKTGSSPLSLACSYGKPLPPLHPLSWCSDPAGSSGGWRAAASDRQAADLPVRPAAASVNSQSSRTRPETRVNQHG